MIEFTQVLEEWSASEQPVALARVIKTWGSSPRPIGSLMLVNERGNMAGSVSGGCVEGAVVKRSMEAIGKNSAYQLSYGVSDEDAWSVGLSCGGSIRVFLQPVHFRDNPVWAKLLEEVKANRSAIMISALQEGKPVDTLIDEDGNVHGPPIDFELQEAAQQAYKERSHNSVTVGDQDYFLQIFPRKPQLLIIGAAHITVDLVALGKQFGFETIVIDPRGFFAQNVTFTEAPDQILEDYPSEVLDQFKLDAMTFCAILSHDPKIDDNALEVLLPSDAAYIGALGSRKTHAKRTNRLLEKGISQEQIDRIQAPIGMPINARSAREIALAVMGEIIQAKNAFLKR